MPISKARGYGRMSQAPSMVIVRRPCQQRTSTKRPNDFPALFAILLDHAPFFDGGGDAPRAKRKQISSCECASTELEPCPLRPFEPGHEALALDDRDGNIGRSAQRAEFVDHGRVEQCMIGNGHDERPRNRRIIDELRKVSAIVALDARNSTCDDLGMTGRSSSGRCEKTRIASTRSLCHQRPYGREIIGSPGDRGIRRL